MTFTSAFRRIFARAVTTALLIAVCGPSASAQQTLLSAYSLRGSGFFTGLWTETSATGTFSTLVRADSGIRVTFRAGPTASPRDWRLIFAAPNDQPLTVGTYVDASMVDSASRPAGRPGIYAERGSTVCVASGEFTILEITYGSGDAVERFSANFRVSCGTGENEFVGSVRINATPRPAHQITVTTTGAGGGQPGSIPSGLACGMPCSALREDGLFTVLVATPDAERGARWGGAADCHDGVILGGASVVCEVTYESCAFTVTPTTVVAATAGSSDVLVRVIASGPRCSWSVDTSQTASWLGYSTLDIGVRVWLRAMDPPMSVGRTATVRIAGQVITVTQPGTTPVYSVGTSFTVGPGGGTYGLPITSNVGDPSWTASSSSDWISVPSRGTSLTVPVTVPRTTVSGMFRVGTIVVAGQMVRVLQRGNGIPGEPLGLTARVQNGRARFFWRPPETEGDATRYLLEAGLSRYSTTVSFAASGPALELEGVPDGRYFVRVRGINEFGMGVASEDYVLEVRGGMNPPDLPVGVTVARSSDLRMSWTPPASGGDVDGYVLQVGSRPGAGDFGLIPLGPTTTLVYPSPPASCFYLSIRAVNAAGLSRPSEERLGAPTHCHDTPSAPQDLKASVSGTSVSFSWTATQDGASPVRYVLAFGTESGQTTATIDVLPVWSGFGRTLPTSASFAAVPRGRYYVRVSAVGEKNVSPASSEVYVHVR